MKLNAPFFFKLKYYEPNQKNQSKNIAHIQYIGTRPGVHTGEPNFEEEFGAAEHMKYMSERPRSHGLFGPGDEADIDLEEVQKELSSHDGYTWRAIVSLREDDATRLGYTERDSWEKTLRASMNEVAGKMGIRETNLKWYAAFHQEQGHPHCHIIFWEKVPERFRWTEKQSEQEIREMRKVFIQHIWADERRRLGDEQTLLREILRDKAKDFIDAAALTELEIKSLVGTEPGIPPKIRDERDFTINQLGELQEKLINLAEMMPSKGRVALKYMPSEVKKEVHEIADWLMEQPEMQDSVKRIEEIAHEYSTPYSFQKQQHDLAAAKARKDIRNRLAQIVLKGAAEIEIKDGGDETGKLAPISLPSKHGEYNFAAKVETDGNLKQSPDEKEKVLEDTVTSFWGDAWRAADRLVYKNNPDAVRISLLKLNDPEKDEVEKKLTEIAEQLSYFEFQGKPMLAYLPKEIQSPAKELALYLLNETSLAKFQGDLSEIEKRQLYMRVANMAVEYASQLNPVDLPEFDFKIHQERVSEVLEQLSKVSLEYIKHDEEEARWTIKAFNQVCVALKIKEEERMALLQSFAGSIYDIAAIRNIINDEKIKVWLVKDEMGEERLSTKNWNRFRNNLGLEEEQLLRPWFATVKAEEQQEAPIKPVLVEERIAEAVEALKNATQRPSNNQELGWTLNAMNNSLFVLGVSNEERKNTIKEWIKVSQVEIAESRLRDILDRTDVAPIEGFSLGKESWQRLCLNLGIEEIPDAPWEFQEKDIKALNIFNETWRMFNNLLYKTTGNKSVEEPQIVAKTVGAVGNKLESLVENINDLERVAVTSINDLPLELQKKVISIRDTILNAEAYQVQLKTNEAITEKLPVLVENKIVEVLNSMLPREYIQTEMVMHKGRAETFLDQLKNIDTLDTGFIKEDAKEITWTARSLYKTLNKLGADESTTSEVMHHFGQQVDLNVGRIDILIEREKEYLNKQATYLEGEKALNHVSKYEFKRLIENLGLDENKTLYPWFAMSTEQDNKLGDIKYEIAFDSKEKIVSALKEAMGSPSLEELNWTVHILNNVLHSIGVDNLERKELINDWVKRADIDISQINLRDILDRSDLINQNENDFFIGNKNWQKLCLNLGIFEEIENPYRFDVARPVSITKAVWKSAWRSIERERSKAEAQMELAQRREAQKEKYKREQEEKENR